MQTGAAFCELLRACRLAVGLTQEALAERTGMSARTIRLLEQGGSRPHEDTARRLASALSLTDDQREQFRASARPLPRQRTGFAPQRSTSSHLPLAPTRLVGREEALAAVLTLLQQDDI